MPDWLSLLSFGPDGWGDQIAAGALVTVGLAVATLPFGLAMGFLTALAKTSDEPTLRISAEIYTTVFRGLPELLTLFIIYYGAQILLQQFLSLFTDTYIEINGFVAGMIALGVVFSSYASEVFQSALKGVPRGQYEGAGALGLSRGQTMRLVILPQLIRLALPGLSNLWLVLLKDTALVSVIGIEDILRQAGIAARVTKEAFLFFGIACLIYLLFSILSSIGIARIERWASRGNVR
ncbi:ABC transporter permease [Amorphus sp. 3PC139-8]|uniref:ABC transporter permease n=1 Tax=Amorphus sp. 3PC139-8 TaxID=2735676 RepID=UPI00345DB0CC